MPNTHKTELIRLFNSVKLPPNAPEGDKNELKKLRALLADKKTKIPGETEEQQLAEICFIIITTFEYINSLRTDPNKIRLLEFAQRIQNILTHTSSYRPGT